MVGLLLQRLHIIALICVQMDGGRLWLDNLFHSRELVQSATKAIFTLLTGLSLAESHSSLLSSLAIQNV